jgi:tetratricopeptide (TPR) repeat protein
MAEEGAIPVSVKKIKKTSNNKNEDLDPANDQFITKTSSALDWAYDHRRVLGLILIMALVVALAGIFVNRYFENKAANESEALAKGLEASIARVVVPEKDADIAPPTADEDDESLTFDSVKARATESLKRWTDAAKKTAELKVMAELGKAGAHLDLGEYDKAVAAYKAFLASKPGAAPFLRVQAVEGLGYALEAAGKDKEAKEAFDGLRRSSQGEIKKMVTYQSARISAKIGDKETAQKLYKEVLASYDDTEKPSRFDVIFVQARTRLLTLDPKAEVPDLPAGSGGGLEGLDPRLLQQLMAQQRAAGAS